MILGLEDIERRLQEMDGWDYEDNALVKEFEAEDFNSALSLISHVGKVAEEAGHHPDILLHSWNKVRVMISTHSEGGVTLKDFELALRIDKDGV